mgnify:CR=1 FL=1
MTKQERLNGNRIIGEFVGKSFVGSHIMDYKGAPNEALPPMKYHINWQWLMRAWYHFVELRFSDGMHQLKHNELKTTIGYAILYGGIELAFTNLVEGIQWYNSIK